MNEKMMAIINFMQSSGYWTQIKSPFQPDREWIAGFSLHGHDAIDWIGRASNAEEALDEAFERYSKHFKSMNNLFGLD